jgi:hypothetical protein
MGVADYLIIIYQPCRGMINIPGARLVCFTVTPAAGIPMLPLSRASRSLITRRASLRELQLTPFFTNATRKFVKPSSADRASVVDVPSGYEDESHFTPRAG